ncbi:MAG: SCO family protein [Akkermansiaceae bacterium]|jgi:cytochrome oxidase Cu insertion factor (SCO1/SenC/PrrC family)
MTDKKKITLIYVGVAVISLMILGMSFFLTTLKKEKRDNSPPATDVGKENVDELAVLGGDIELERQDGSKARISDLHDKVWLAVQYYESCPMCAARNTNFLLEVYKQFRSEDDFVVVCLSVDPEADTKEKLLDVRDRLKADKKNWWFLKGEQKMLWDYMTEVMFFTGIRERFEEVEIAAKGRWAHDMGIHLYRGDTLVHKWHEGLPPEQLAAEVREALGKLGNPAPEEPKP